MKVSDYTAKLDSYRTSLNKGQQAETAGRNEEVSSDMEPKGDRVSLSDEGRLRTEAYKEAMGAPDVRADKVAAIKAQIASGEYQIDSTKIAEGILKEEIDLFV